LAVGLCGSAFACGPFFPDTMLDQPRATLRPPIVNFEVEVRQLAAPSAPPTVAPPTTTLSAESPSAYRSIASEILDPEIKELEGALAGLSEDRRRKLVEDYRALRAAMLLKYSSAPFEAYGLDVSPDGYQLLAQAQLGHWPDGLPKDIVLYLGGALLYNYGQKRRRSKLGNASSTCPGTSGATARLRPRG
jgi:hypothetical protein